MKNSDYFGRDPDSESGPRCPRRVQRRNGSPAPDASARRPYLNSYEKKIKKNKLKKCGIVVAKRNPSVSMHPRWSELRRDVNKLTISFLHVAPLRRGSLRAAAEDF
jgi:hypothetical protein